MRASPRQLTIGQLISCLEDGPSDHPVRFDFGNFVPTSVHSYRGFYEDLAIGYVARDGNHFHIYVSEMLDLLRAAVGQLHCGYKGGLYLASKDSVLWVANRGETTGTIVTGVDSDDHVTVIDTGWASV